MGILKKNISPKERTEKAMNRIADVLKDYNCRMDVQQSIIIIPNPEPKK